MKEKLPKFTDMPSLPRMPSFSGPREASASVVTSGKPSPQGQIYVGAKTEEVDRADVVVAAYPDMRN